MRFATLVLAMMLVAGPSGATHQDEDLFDFLLYVRTDFVPNVEFIDVQIRAARVDFTPAAEFNRGETCEENIFGNPHNCFSWCNNCGGGRTCPPGQCHRLGTTEVDWLETQGVFVAQLRLFDDDCEDSCDVAVDLIAPDGSILTSRIFTYEDVTQNQGDILFIGREPLDPPPPPSYDELADDLDACEDDLSSCESDFVDPDSDGVDGRSDACPFTEAGEIVDARGCSLAQFCADQSARNCNASDFRDDEIGNPFDCTMIGGACAPNLLTPIDVRPGPPAGVPPAWGRGGRRF